MRSETNFFKSDSSLSFKMLQFLSSFELGSLHPCFHDSLTIIDPPYAPPTGGLDTINNSLVADYVFIYANSQHDIFALTISCEVYRVGFPERLISTGVIYIDRNDHTLLLVHANGLVKLGQRTIQLQVPYGIRNLYKGFSGCDGRLVIETMDNYLYVIHLDEIMPARRSSIKSLLTRNVNGVKRYSYVLEDDLTFECSRCR